MKCSACENNKCKGRYDNKDECVGKKEGIDCTCTCQESLAEEIAIKGLSILGGVVATVGGIALTVLTGGAAAIIGGGFIAGLGSSLAFNPITKLITNERMTVADTATDVLLGATIGVVTGGIGIGADAFTSFATKALTKAAAQAVTQTAAQAATQVTAQVATQTATKTCGTTIAKLCIRAGTGAVGGAVSGVASECGRIANGEDVTVGSVLKSVGYGALVGTVGGTAAHGASAASNKVTNEVGKIATRVIVQGGTAAATDATIQLIQTGKIDLKQTALLTVGQISMATVAEATSAGAQRTKKYSEKVNKELMSNLHQNDADEINKVIEKANKLNNLRPDANRSPDAYSINELDNSRVGQVAATFGENREKKVLLQKFKNKYLYLDHTTELDLATCKKSLILKDINNPIKGEMDLLYNIGETYERPHADYSEDDNENP